MSDRRHDGPMGRRDPGTGFPTGLTGVRAAPLPGRCDRPTLLCAQADALPGPVYPSSGGVESRPNG
jgi:hypothetical protein